MYKGKSLKSALEMANTDDSSGKYKQNL